MAWFWRRNIYRKVSLEFPKIRFMIAKSGIAGWLKHVEINGMSTTMSTTYPWLEMVYPTYVWCFWRVYGTVLPTLPPLLGFPKIGVPPDHLFIDWFSTINQPFWGTPIYGPPPDLPLRRSLSTQRRRVQQGIQEPAAATGPDLRRSSRGRKMLGPSKSMAITYKIMWHI